jgi:diaminopimelate epimerase
VVCEARIVGVPVTKMHGAGNDFIVLDRRNAQVEDLPSFARWVCDRRRGVGADGLIAIESSDSSKLRMRTINADGTEAEMCGNGARCAARWLDEAGEGDRISFDTAAGQIRTQVVSREPQYAVRVAMGRPRSAISPLRAIANAFFVDLGNPHVVVFVDDLEGVSLESLAARLQNDPDFPNGTNVHLAMALGPHTIAVRHFERGVGPTLACGTGAVAAAGVMVEKKKAGAPVTVVVPGGQLFVEWDDDGNALLTGPAQRVFDTKLSFEQRE